MLYRWNSGIVSNHLGSWKIHPDCNESCPGHPWLPSRLVGRGKKDQAKLKSPDGMPIVDLSLPFYRPWIPFLWAWMNTDARQKLLLFEPEYRKYRDFFHELCGSGPFPSTPSDACLKYRLPPPMKYSRDWKPSHDESPDPLPQIHGWRIVVVLPAKDAEANSNEPPHPFVPLSIDPHILHDWLGPVLYPQYTHSEYHGLSCHENVSSTHIANHSPHLP